MTITGGKNLGNELEVKDTENIKIQNAIVFELSKESLTIAKGFPLTLYIIKNSADESCAYSYDSELATEYGFTISRTGRNLSLSEYPSKYVDRYILMTSYSAPVSNPLMSMGATYSSYPINNFTSIPVAFTSNTGITKTVNVTIHKNPVILDYDFSQIIKGGNMRLHILADFDLPDNVCLVYDFNGKVISDCVYTINYTLGRKGLYVDENPFNIASKYIRLLGNEVEGHSESPQYHSSIENGFYTFNIQSSSILNQCLSSGNWYKFTSYTNSFGGSETVWSVPSRVQLNMNVGFAIIENGAIVQKLNDVDLRFFESNSCVSADYRRNLLYTDEDSNITVDYQFSFIGVDQYSYTTRGTEYVSDGYDFNDYSHVLKYKITKSPSISYRTLYYHLPNKYGLEYGNRFLSDYVIHVEFNEPNNYIDDPIHTVYGYKTDDFYNYTYVKPDGTQNTSGGTISCGAGLNIVHSCPNL